MRIHILLLCLATTAIACQKKSDDTPAPPPKQWNVQLKPVTVAPMSKEQHDKFSSFIKEEDRVSRFSAHDYMFGARKDERGLTPDQQTLLSQVRSTCMVNDPKPAAPDMRNAKVGDTFTFNVVHELSGPGCVLNYASNMSMKMKVEQADQTGGAVSADLDFREAMQPNNDWAKAVVGIQSFSNAKGTMTMNASKAGMAAKIKMETQNSVTPTAVARAYNAHNSVEMFVSAVASNEKPTVTMEMALTSEVMTPDSVAPVVISLMFSMNLTPQDNGKTVPAIDANSLVLQLNGQPVVGQERAELLNSKFVQGLLLGSMSSVSTGPVGPTSATSIDNFDFNSI